MKNISQEDWEMLKNDAKKVINSIDILHMNDEDYVMFGASLAILNPVIMKYFELNDETYQFVAQSATGEKTKPIQSRIKTIDFVPNSYADELRQESLMHFVDYNNEKGLEIITGTRIHGERAENALRKMLKTDEQVAEALYRSANEKERKLILESYQRIMGKL